MKLHSYKFLAYHVCGWLILIIYELSILAYVTKTIPPITHYLFNYVVNISLFYCNALLAFPLAFEQRRPFLSLSAILIAEIALYILLIFFVGNLILYSAEKHINIIFDIAGVVKAVWRGLYFILLSTAFWFAKRIVEQSKNIAALENDRLLKIIAGKELEKSLMRSQNAYLQSRLNPHLLFNTLNFLYDSVYDVSADTAKSVLLLSDIMRYSLQESSSEGKTLLANEIECIENYISLHQLRVRNQLNIETSFVTDDPHAEIIPLLLVSFVENIFKHGNFSDPGKSAFVSIRLQNGTLKFFSRNHKRAGSNAGFGLGISNNQIRLENYYYSNFSLSLNDAPNIFELTLTVHL